MALFDGEGTGGVYEGLPPALPVCYNHPCLSPMLRAARRRYMGLANIKSSKKDIVRSRQRRLRNLAWKSRAKTEVRKARAAVAASQSGAADLTRYACRVLDRAAAKGVIHKRQAARRKSRLARRLARLAVSGSS